MKLKNSITTLLVVWISAFYILATYLPNLLGTPLPLQEELFLIKKALFPDGQIHGVMAGEWWRVITVVLTHGSWTHLLFNMLALFQLGNLVENFYGRARYIFILLISLLVASAATLIFDPTNIPAVGASGMIFGLFSAMLVTGKRMGVDYRQVGVVIALNLAMTFIMPNIDWHAHVGGLIGGALATFILRAFPKRRAQLYYY
jgi:membrane associated rhomboid family serine protease